MPLTPLKTDPNYKVEKQRAAKQPETFGPDVVVQSTDRILPKSGGLVGDAKPTSKEQK
jgi:hypothetical protein